MIRGSTIESPFIAGHDLGTSSSAARMSLATRRASGMRDDSSSAVSSSTIPDADFPTWHGAGSSCLTLFTEAILDISSAKRLDHWLDFTIQNFCQLMHVEPDAVVGHPILGKIVCANLR